MSDRYRMVVSYRGCDFAGWQRQSCARTVQQELETALGRLTREPVRVHGSGRTDAGVHARGQVAHFDLQRRFPCRGLVHGGNHLLPDDVRILRAERIASGSSLPFDARRSARSKEYRYSLSRSAVLSPLDAPFMVRIRGPLDLCLVRRSLETLVGRHDFAAFTKTGSGHQSTVRSLFAAELLERGEQMTLVFVGEGFLRGMVRGLVGTLIDVGLRRRAPELSDLLQGRASDDGIGAFAPAHGLCLQSVQYADSWRLAESYPCAADEPCRSSGVDR